MEYIYHLTPRPNKKAKHKVWYAWYYDEHGSRVHRSTGCRRKEDAQKEIQKWIREEGPRAPQSLEQLAGHYFVPGDCPYLRRRRNLKEKTIKDYRYYLTKVILPAYGKRVPDTITAPEVERWVEKSFPDRSDSWRGLVVNTLRIVLRELRRDGKIKQVPDFLLPPKEVNHADDLTSDELDQLFPKDEIDLALIWTKCKHIEYDENGDVEKTTLDPRDRHGLMFGLMFMTQVQAGMRPGEIRALTMDHLYPQFSGIHIAQQIDTSGKISPLKKATSEERRERLVRIPEATMQQILAWAESQGISSGILFRYNDAPVRDEYLRARFQSGLANARIKIRDRRLIPYSLRYTYRSMVEGHLKREQIKAQMGHLSDEMSLYYLNVHPDQFKTLEIDQASVETIWDRGGR